MIFSNIATASLNVISKRFLRKKIVLKSWPNDWVPFHWKRPETRPGYLEAGDLVDLHHPKTEELLPEVRLSRELKQLDPNDPMRKLFSLDHSSRGRQNKAFADDHIHKMGLIHEVDYANSLEAKIVKLTFALRHVHEVLNKPGANPRYNAHTRSAANSIKYRRYRYLCDLKELHGERYERLIKTLSVEPKNNPINVPFYRPYRKVQMRKLAIEYARDLKEKKVEEFMQSIEDEKKSFELERQQTLKWIEEQEKKLGITV